MDETEMKKMFELSQQNSANSGLEITPEVSPPFLKRDCCNLSRRLHC
jgi:hypothetical protein